MEHSAAPSPQTVERQRRPNLNQRLAVRRRGLGAPLLPGRSVSPILDACASGVRQGPPERASYRHRSPPRPLDLCEDYGNLTRRRQTERRPSLVQILEDPTAAPIPGTPGCEEDVENARCKSPLQITNRVLSPRSPIDVLKELSAPTRQRQNLGRRSIAKIDEDTTPIKETRRNPSTSWYEETSNNSSPTPNYNNENTMHCTEAFVLPKERTPLTSPLAGKDRRQQRSLRRSKSSEASLYIDHLEYQLASAQTQLEAYTSPAMTNIASAELHRLTKESETLRREVEDWERKFEETVAEEMRRRIELETRLRASITHLEQEMACKGERVVELEEELESAQQRVKEVERGSRFVVARAKQMKALEAANRDLEGRVDVLTMLLAQNQSLPTTPSSPDRTVARNMPPRPRSMGEFGTERRMRRFHSGVCTLRPLILPGAVEEPLRSEKSLAEELHSVGEDEGLELVGVPEDVEGDITSPYRSMFRWLWDAWRKGTQMVRAILGSISTTLPLRVRRCGWWILGLFFRS